jgi:hypothetical protein
VSKSSLRKTCVSSEKQGTGRATVKIIMNVNVAMKEILMMTE